MRHNGACLIHTTGAMYQRGLSDKQSGHDPFFDSNQTFIIKQAAGKIWGEEDDPGGLGGSSPSVLGGFTPRPIRHGPHDVDLSSSSAMESLQAGLPSYTKLERSTSRGPYPGIMSKPYPFWASDNPLWQCMPLM